MSDPDSASGDVSFRDLQTFVSVATTGSFRAAAKRLYLSQPAISRTIARLERSLGVTLFERGPRGGTLTAAGTTLLEHARRVGAAMASLRAGLRDGASRELRLGAAATATATYLAPFLAVWMTDHPDVHIEVIEDGSIGLRERLTEGECDLAIVALPTHREFETAPIADLAVRAYFPRAHALDTGESTITVQELAKWPLVINSSGYLASRLFLAECEASGVFAEIRYRSKVGQTLASLAEAGLGVAVFADSVPTRGFDLASRLVVDRDEAPLAFTLAAAWPRIGTPPWIEDFGRSLAQFTASHAR